MKNYRTLAAFLIAPLVPTVVFAHTAGFGLSLAWSYLCTLAFGVPVFLTLRALKKENHFLYGLCGGLCGAFYILAINYANPLPGLLVALFFAIVGAATSLCFSLIRGPARKLPHHDI